MHKETKTMIRRLGMLATLAALAALLLAPSAAPASAAEPVWRIDSLANSTAEAGATQRITLQLSNIGDAEADGTGGDPIEFTASLPPGMSVHSVTVPTGFGAFDWSSLAPYGWSCTGDGPGGAPGVEGAHNLTCTIAAAIEPHKFNFSFINFQPVIEADVDLAATGTLTSRFTLSGAGANEATTAEVTRVGSAAGFGIDSFDAQTAGPEGGAFTQAAGHPDAFTTYLDFNTKTNPRIPPSPVSPSGQDARGVEAERDVSADLPPGLLGNPASLPVCDAREIAAGSQADCPVDSQVGTVVLPANGGGSGTDLTGPFPLFNMAPPPGAPAQFAFNFYGVVTTLRVRLRSGSDYGLSILASRISEGLDLSGSYVTVWGAPADSAHDPERACRGERAPEYVLRGAEPCATSAAPSAFLRMPTACTPAGQGLPFSVAIDSWVHPGAFLTDGLTPDMSDPAWATASIESHEAPGYPLPERDNEGRQWGETVGVDGCADVAVNGELAAQTTALEAETSSGLSVHVDVPNPVLENPNGIASSDIKAMKVSLPEGVTINPSEAEGLGTCSEAQYESSRLEFHPDGAHGCPSDSKIGTVEVHTPLLHETVPGTVYIAKPYANPEGSLLALYIVLEEPQRGVLIKLPAKVETDGTSGRIVTTIEDMPQLPFSSIDMKLREGARAPLVTPPTCGTYDTETQFTGWSDPAHPITSSSSFQITRGIGGGACPSGGTPGFKPGFSAGSINNDAGSHTEFDMRLTRKDGEQDMTRFSAVLPPGVLGKLAGVGECPESAIAAARAKSGVEEQQSPSCPASSEIGRSVVGAGVGSVLTYVPGKIYLGGPFNGDPLSIIAITPAVAGPFDVGTVVVHEALTLNPRTAEVEVDGSASDPIPHILKGIPAKLRDLRVYVDRPDFILNPTSCDPSQTTATLFGSGANPFDNLDDVPVSLADRFQAASCASLGFKPRLGLKLNGGAGRGAYPGLQAVYRPRKGDANAAGLVVRLPLSAFLEQGHIRTICTRVQFAADSCPKGSVYGHIRAWTPLLDEPLKGPVYLRSSNHNLPDMVFDLHGLVDVEVATRIDSIHGGIRATVEGIPDAPLSKVLLRMQGGRKGLIVNSRNLCFKPRRNRANSAFTGQNGKRSVIRPVLRATGCGKHRRHVRHHKRGARVARSSVAG